MCLDFIFSDPKFIEHLKPLKYNIQSYHYTLKLR